MTKKKKSEWVSGAFCVVDPIPRPSELLSNQIVETTRDLDDSNDEIY